SDQRLTISSPIIVPLNATQATLTFWHNYSFESANGGFTPYDGGGLEVSTDGLTWTDAVALNLITSGGYNGRLVAGCSSQNPLAGRLAWVNSSGGWRQVTVSLS